MKVRATFSGFVGLDGVPTLMHEGEDWESDHPLVVARPELFTDPIPEPKRPVLKGKAATAKDAEVKESDA